MTLPVDGTPARNTAETRTPRAPGATNGPHIRAGFVSAKLVDVTDELKSSARYPGMNNQPALRELGSRRTFVRCISSLASSGASV
ncbi:hypothetical protein FS749_014255 [Ceratobasidium sp. UAMH 11750]|nr:hypothetical protein FS749_014255 [Ceratobasidium sp. UAMH 11750]